MTLSWENAKLVLIGHGLTDTSARNALADARRRGHSIAQAGITTVRIGHRLGRFTLR